MDASPCPEEKFCVKEVTKCFSQDWGSFESFFVDSEMKKSRVSRGFDVTRTSLSFVDEREYEKNQTVSEVLLG